MIIDTHAHLAHENLLSRFSQILKNAKENGVEKIISIGCDLDEISESEKLANQNESVYFTAGLYPHDNIKMKNIPDKEKLNLIKPYLKEQKCVAVGESGFDFSDPPPYEIKRGENEQRDLFIDQIGLAKEFNKPLIIHSRKAISKTLEVISTEYKNTNKLNGVWHCFMENYEVLKSVLALGFYIGVGGLITYPKNRFWVADILSRAPLDRILLETDSPYLTPHRYRSLGAKINEPAFLDEIVVKLSEVFGKDKDYIEDITHKNSMKLFFSS